MPLQWPRKTTDRRGQQSSRRQKTETSGYWLSSLEKPEIYIPKWSEVSEKLDNWCPECQRTSGPVSHRCVRAVWAGEEEAESVQGTEPHLPLSSRRQVGVTVQRGWAWSLLLGTPGPVEGGSEGAPWKCRSRESVHIYRFNYLGSPQNLFPEPPHKACQPAGSLPSHSFSFLYGVSLFNITGQARVITKTV